MRDACASSTLCTVHHSKQKVASRAGLHLHLRILCVQVHAHKLVKLAPASRTLEDAAGGFSSRDQTLGPNHSVFRLPSSFNTHPGALASAHRPPSHLRAVHSLRHCSYLHSFLALVPDPSASPRPLGARHVHAPRADRGTPRRRALVARPQESGVCAHSQTRGQDRVWAGVQGAPEW